MRNAFSAVRLYDKIKGGITSKCMYIVGNAPQCMSTVEQLTSTINFKEEKVLKSKEKLQLINHNLRI